MARPARPKRSTSARPSRQLSRFYRSINSDMVFGTHSPYFYGQTIKDKRPRGHYTAWPLRDYPTRPQRPFAADQGSRLRGRQSADMATRRSRIQTYTAQGGIGWGNLPKRMVQENLDSGRLMQICLMPKAVADLHQRDDQSRCLR